MAIKLPNSSKYRVSSHSGSSFNVILSPRHIRSLRKRRRKKKKKGGERKKNTNDDVTDVDNTVSDNVDVYIDRSPKQEGDETENQIEMQDLSTTKS